MSSDDAALTSWISLRRSPVCDPVRAWAVIRFVSEYSATSGERSVDAIT